MTDRECWDITTARVAADFARLSAGRRAAVAEAAAAIKVCKAGFHAVVDAVAAGEVCASCGGACCMTGKYHVTAIDLLVYLVDGKELFTPRFDQGGCPYLGNRGCLMAPPYRPYTCVIFNCELVEGLLAPPQKERLSQLEALLRGHYAGLEELFGRRLMGGVLMYGERSPLPGRRTIPDLNECGSNLTAADNGRE